LGVPDRFVEHQSRAEVLQELRLDPEGIVKTVLELAAQRGLLEADFQTV